MASNEKKRSPCLLIQFLSIILAMAMISAEQERNCSKSNSKFAHKKDLDGRLGVYPVLEFTSVTKLDCSIACQRLAFCNAFSVTSSRQMCYLYSHRVPRRGRLQSGALTFVRQEERGACPSDFEYVHPNFCYSFSKVPVSYSDASLRCRDGGGRLATLDTQEKVDAFLDFYGRYKGILVITAWYWLGATDLQTPGTWVWEATGQAFQAPWSRQPLGGIYHCLLYGAGNTHGFYDNPCDMRRRYICEWAALL